MADLSSEEKYRLGMITREERELDMMHQDYDRKRARVSDGEFALGGTERVNELHNLAQDIRKKSAEVGEQKRREREKQKEKEFRQYSNTVDGIVLGAKARYDEKMSAYMKKNFWGKAKTMLSGKKPKKMSDMEIMQTYASEVAQDQLSMMIAIRKRELDEELAWIESYYKAHPNELEGDTIEDRKQWSIRYHEAEIERLKASYQQMLERAMKNVDSYGIDFIEEHSGLGR